MEAKRGREDEKADPHSEHKAAKVERTESLEHIVVSHPHLSPVDLPPELQKQLDKVRKKRNFSPAEWIDKKTDMLVRVYNIL